MGVVAGVSRGSYGAKHFGTCSYCKRDNECFARTYGRCGILIPDENGKVTFASGSCSFKKRDREVTNDKSYPHRDKK